MQIETEIDIVVDSGAADVFAVLLALDRYADWLPDSGVHKGIEVIGEWPVQGGPRTWIAKVAAPT